MRALRNLRLCSLLILIGLTEISGHIFLPSYLLKKGDASLSQANVIKQTVKEEIAADSFITLRAVGRGNPWISLNDGCDLPTTYYGRADLTQTLEQNQAQPLTLTSADFDEDGVPDLVIGYAGAGKGMLTLSRGSLDSIFPNSPRSDRNGNEIPITVKDQGAKRLPAPSIFSKAALVFDLPEPPDFLGAGDFDGDSHSDIVAAARRGSNLYLLSGDGQGGFEEAKAIEIGGSVTALVTGEVNRADGLTDLAAAITGQDGSEVLVFESPQGALKDKPETFSVPAEATGLALGKLDEDFYSDLAVAAGDTLVMIHGRDRKLSLEKIRQAAVQPALLSQHSFSSAINSIAIGDFTGGHKSEIALLTADGAVQVIGGDGTRTRRQGERSGWQAVSAFSVPSSARLLIKARVSSEPRDNLIVMDADNHQLRVVMIGGDPVKAAGRSRPVEGRVAPGDLQVTLDVEGEPVAVLPMRLNEDILSDLVVLRNGNSVPTVALTVAAMTFTVTNTNGSGAGSLRQAILDANANPGADMIRFSIASGERSIAPGSALPAVTEAVTIDGTTQPGFTGKPLIEINGKKIVSPGLFISGGNSTVRGLVINRFEDISFEGIHLTVNGGNLIEGNFIGTDSRGTVDKGNGGQGILCRTRANTIGGTVADARNVISGNDQQGIYLLGPSATGNVIAGNFIGTDVTGTSAIPNEFGGVFIDRAPSNIIGGTVAGARNIFANSGSNIFSEGIIIDGIGASNNLIQGNFIGLDVSGKDGLGHGVGVEINREASTNTIGGTVASARNVISKNGAGIRLFGGSTDNLVQGNFIGTDVTGTVAMGNSFGVNTTSTPFDNTIGGAVTGARNIISGNTRSGVDLQCDDNRVQGNFIGTDVTGTVALGNGGSGVELSGDGNLVGGNTIAFNDGAGITIFAGTSNPIRGNSIFLNRGLGIGLGGSGVTLNDPCDGDGGSNNLQNFPVITAATVSATGTVIEGTLNSRPNSQFTIEFFSSNSCDIRGNGEGETFIGSVTTTTDSSCNASFSAALPISISPGQFITATATDSNNNTSEFSRCFPQNAAPGPNVFTAFIRGKNLVVIGEGFDSGTVILLNGEAQKTRNDSQSPTTQLVGKKVGKKIASGQTVSVRVRRADLSLSNQITFTR